MDKNIRGLFIMGNKRSGSTLLMYLLNTHPNIYISNESDLIWILYQLNKEVKPVPYTYDSPKGFNSTMRIFNQDIPYSKKKSIAELFFTMQLEIMQKGINSIGSLKKNKIKYIGDQKPFQHSDPELVEFIEKEFKKPKYIHIIRDPNKVIRSCQNFSKKLARLNMMTFGKTSLVLSY